MTAIALLIQPPSATGITPKLPIRTKKHPNPPSLRKASPLQKYSNLANLTRSESSPPNSLRLQPRQQLAGAQLVRVKMMRKTKKKTKIITRRTQKRMRSKI